jgi:predicted CXXCH cytochrome family protein
VFILSAGVSDAKIKLKTDEPALCYKCHNELKERLNDNVTHFLFRQGKCSSCHNPHVSRDRGLLRDEINPLCLSCHESIKNLIGKAVQHSAIRDGACTDCHNAHSSENKNLLVRTEKELCWECHEELKVQLDNKFFCLPFKNGECSACHNPHGASEDNLLFEKPIDTCKKCHTTINCKAGDASIASVTKKMDCISCHSGHSSDKKGILGPYAHSIFLEKKCGECHKPISEGREIVTKYAGDRLCLNCHEKDTSIIDDDVHRKDPESSCIMCHGPHASEKTNLTINESKLCVTCHEDTEKRTFFMEKALKSKRECEPIKNRECFECHVPVHSDKNLNFREDEFQLCNKCHEAEHKITHPMGPDVIDVRNGQPITCISCHSMHAASSKFMLTHDGKRTLCIQCHTY